MILEYAQHPASDNRGIRQPRREHRKRADKVSVGCPGKAVMGRGMFKEPSLGVQNCPLLCLQRTAAGAGLLALKC